jgi:hypothetical protein
MMVTVVMPTILVLIYHFLDRNLRQFIAARSWSLNFMWNRRNIPETATPTLHDIDTSQT